jgi:hypothetical protein
MKAALVLSAFCLFVLSSAAYANDSLKIKTIKSFYESSIFYDSDRETYSSDPEVIYNYADDSLARALVLQDDVMESEGMICGEFLGAVMWDTNDSDVRTKINYSANRDGRVKVKFGYGGTSLYSLKCDKTSCQITDIYINTSPPSSLKSMINKECR